MVTIDAMGCQENIVAKIIEKGADYIIPVKDNQLKLLVAVAGQCERALREGSGTQDISFHETENKAHGRVERRRCWTLPVPEGFPCSDDWAGLASLVYIESERTLGGKTSFVPRWHISSKKGLQAEMDRVQIASCEG